MAVTKEAIVIVLDVGKNMHNKEFPTSLEEAKECISMIIQRKIFSESKDEIALILFGTSETSNKLAEQYSGEYTNITLVQDLQLVTWELLEIVNGVKGTDMATDFIDALVVAMDVLYYKLRDDKEYSGRILFFSNFRSRFSTHQLNKICNAIKVRKMELNFIGPVAIPVGDIDNKMSLPGCKNDNDSDGPESLITEKPKNYLSYILREVNGESYSYSDVLPALIYYQKKKTQATPWNANLEIGSNLTIPISAYSKVMESKPKGWKNAYAFKLNAKIEQKRSYCINDESQTEITKDDIISAFKYGTTLVPYTDEDKLNMDYKTPDEKGIKVLGFTKAENIERFHYSGDKTMYVFGQKNRELAGVILAPFIHALHDTKMVAIVRYLYSARSMPKIGFLSPRIKENYECLVYVSLPFMEDLRYFVFSPLDSDSKNIPTEEQLGAVDELISAMDLTIPNGEESEEILKPKNTVNPYVQHLYQCLQFKALNPEKPLPPIEPHIQELINPSPKVLKRAETALDKIKSLFPIKETVEKKQTEAESYMFNNGKTEEPAIKKSISMDQIDFTPEEKHVPESKLIDAVTDKVIEVGSINPVRDFQYLINNKVLPFNDVCQQLMDVVVKYLQEDNAHLRMYHSKILSICKEFRFASLKERNCVKYNSFINTLQNVLLECDEDLWNKIRNEKIGLIIKEEIPTSTVSSEQAEMFLAKPLSGNSPNVIESFEAQEEDDYDLLDQL